MADDDLFDPAGGTPDTPDPIEGDDAKPEIAKLTRERDELRDRLLRQAAEFDNYRKRIERERRAQADESVTRLLLDLLLVIDDFDLALSVDVGGGASAYRKGVELMHGKLHDLLKKQGVSPIQALGVDFDPNLHQSVTHEASPGHRDGEVIGELRKGYMLGDRLLRPSMVKVAQG